MIRSISRRIIKASEESCVSKLYLHAATKSLYLKDANLQVSKKLLQADCWELLNRSTISTRVKQALEILFI